MPMYNRLHNGNSDQYLAKTKDKFRRLNLSKRENADESYNGSGVYHKCFIGRLST